MTREKAIDYFIMTGFGQFDARLWIERFEKLGMLKLEEPKTVEQKFAQLTIDMMPATMFWELNERMKANNLKIVEK